MDIKLSNGDVVVFPDKLKGRHVMAIRKMQGSVLVDGEVDGGKYVKNLYELFPALATVRKGEQEVPATVQYLEELDADDFEKIENKLIEFSTVEPNKKK